MAASYNRHTGEYRITIVAYEDAPFRDSLRVNINLLNWDLGTASYPAFFSNTMNDMMLNEPASIQDACDEVGVRHCLLGVRPSDRAPCGSNAYT